MQSRPTEPLLFLSYARADAASVERLHAALVRGGRRVWRDAEELPADPVDWRTGVACAIDAAAVVVFVISPESVASPMCRYELEYAAQRGKQIVPLLLRDVETGGVPGVLASRRWVPARGDDEWETALEYLSSPR